MKESKQPGKKCAKCGEEFGCNALLSNCWCNNYQLSKAQLAQLKEKFSNCLCENCIKKISKELN